MKDLRKKFLNLFKKNWPIFGIVLVVLAFFWKTIFLGQIPFPGDFVTGIYYPWLDYKWGFLVGVPVKNPIVADVPSFIYPMQTFAIDLMKNGEWPLWNPHILTGVPLLANFQSAPFSPTIFFYFLFDKITAWSLQIILQHVLTATFTYFLLRNWKVSKLGSAVGGLIFAFSGFNLIWSQWNGHTLASSFIPLLLLFEDRWLKRGKFLDGAGVSFALCLQIFSGYPQTVLYTAVAAGLLWLVRMLGDKKWLFKTILLGVFFAIGLGLSAPQLFPGAELLLKSQWTAEPHPFEWAFLPWSKVVTFFAPDYFGNHSTGNWWGPQDYTSNTGFVGVIAFTLAMLSLRFFTKKKKEIVFSISLFVVALVLSFATPVSIFLWKNNLFGMQSSSGHRALVLFNLGVALLAGFGIDSLKSRFKFKYKQILIPLIVLVGYGVYAATLRGVVVREIVISKVALRNLIFPGALLLATIIVLWAISKWKKLTHVGVGFLTFLLIFELFRFGWKFTPFSTRDLVFPKTPVLDFLTTQEKPFRVTSNRVIPSNLAMPYGLESLEGYETMRPALSSQFLASLNKNSSEADPSGRYGIIDNDTSHLLDMVNTKYYLTLKRNEKDVPDPEGKIPKRFEISRFKLAFEDKTVAVLESNSALPRALMIYDWDVIEDDKEMLEKLLDPIFPMSSKIILEEDVSVHLSPNTQSAGRVEYLVYGNQGSKIEIETENDGMLFVSDAWFPGWKAYVDGEETKIYRANYAFRAIPVPSGSHEIVFVYRPDSFFNGLKTSGVSVVCLLIIGFVLGRKKLQSYT